MVPGKMTGPRVGRSLVDVCTASSPRSWACLTRTDSKLITFGCFMIASDLRGVGGFSTDWEEE